MEKIIKSLLGMGLLACSSLADAALIDRGGG